MRNKTRFKYLGKTQSKKIQWVTRLSHLALLLLIFVGPEIPFTMSMPSKAIRFVAPMCYIGVFYLNYNYLTDRFLFHNKRIMTYTAINLVLIIAVVSLFYYIFYPFVKFSHTLVVQRKLCIFLSPLFILLSTGVDNFVDNFM